MSNSASAAVMAASASSRADESKEIACKAFMPSYQHATATQEQARIYAECVKVVYPAPMSGAEIVALKALFLVCIATGAFCVWRERHYGQSFGDRVALFALSSFLCALVCVGAFWALVGVIWVFTA